MIPDELRRRLARLVEEDLKGATVVSACVMVDGAGEIEIAGLGIETQDGRRLFVGKAPIGSERWERPDVPIILETKDGDEWREVSIHADYAGDLEEMLHPDDLAVREAIEHDRARRQEQQQDRDHRRLEL